MTERAKDTDAFMKAVDALERDFAAKLEALRASARAQPEPTLVRDDEGAASAPTPFPVGRSGLGYRDEVLLALAGCCVVGHTPKAIAEAILAPGEWHGDDHYERTYRAIKRLERQALIEKRSGSWHLTTSGEAAAVAVRALLPKQGP